MEISRPTEAETEDDLIRLQEEFLKGNTKSSTILLRKDPPSVVTTATASTSSRPLSKTSTPGIIMNEVFTKKKSVFSQRRQDAKYNEIRESNTNILSDVVETFPVFKPMKDYVKNVSGFPLVYRRSEQTFLKNTLNDKVVSQDKPVALSAQSTLNESIGIHQENLNQLGKMSREEIEEAKQDILSRLDPTLVQYLMKRNGKNDTKSLVLPIQIDNELNTDKSHVTQFIKQHIPANQIEYPKLEWMRNVKPSELMPVPTPDSIIRESLDKIRFDLQGHEVDQGIKIDSHLGLHHHSKQDTEIGYNLGELLQLSRSSSAPQRVLATSVLEKIVINLKYMTNMSSRSQIIVGFFVEQMSVVLCFRMGLDDLHESVVHAGLNGLISYFEFVNLNENRDKEESLFDLAVFVDNRSFAQSRKSQLNKEKSDTEFNIIIKKTGEYTMEDIRNTIDMDPILGLFMSNILVRLDYLLESGYEHLFNDILILISTFAHHSIFIVTQMVSLNLPKTISKFIDIHLPISTKDNGRVVCAYHAIKVIRLIVTSSKKNCISVFKSIDLFNLISRFLLFNAEDPTIILIRTEIFLILDVTNAYNVEGHIFDDFRQIIVDCAVQKDALRTKDYWLYIASIAKYLVSLTVSYESAMRIGTQNDALRIFVEILLKKAELVKFDESIECDIFLGQFYTLLSHYIQRMPLPQAKTFCQFCFKHSSISEFKSSYFVKNIISTFNENYMVKSQVLYHNNTWTFENLILKENLTFQSMFCSTLSSYIKLNHAFTVLNEQTMPDLLTFCHQIYTTIIQPLSTTLNQILPSNRIFAMGSINLVSTWFTTMKALSDRSYIDDQMTVNIFNVGLALVPTFLPGDEYALKQVYDHILDPLVLMNVFQMQLNSKEMNAWSHLSEIYFMHSFNEQTLEVSHSFRHEAPMKSLMLERGNHVRLPLSSDWLFLSIPTLTAEMKINLKSSGGRVLLNDENKEIDTDNGAIIDAMLRFILLSKKSLSLNPYNTLINLMQLYLLPSLKFQREEEIFSITSIESKINTILDIIIRPQFYTRDPNSTSVHHLEASAGGQAKFYKLYRDLVYQYTSVSFGNPTFRRVMLVPLASCFSVDYRKLFWNELIGYMKGFTNTAESMGGLEVFTSIKEVDDEILTSYASSLKNCEISQERNPLLFEICKTQLNRCR